MRRCLQNPSIPFKPHSDIPMQYTSRYSGNLVDRYYFDALRVLNESSSESAPIGNFLTVSNKRMCQSVWELFLPTNRY